MSRSPDNQNTALPSSPTDVGSSCLRDDELISFFKEESLAQSEATARIANHLRDCAACSARADQLSGDASLDGFLSSYRRMVKDSTGVPVPAEYTRMSPLTWGLLTAGGAMDGCAPDRDPAMFGRYRLDRLLGRGGFGIVYLAEDTVLHRVVALKFATANTLFDPSIRGRFISEAQIVAKLHHPNIVPVYEAGETEGQCFLASEFIPGPTLADHLKDTGPLVADVAARLVERLALAVQHAHERGVLHRDIKPGNVLLDPRTTATSDTARNSPYPIDVEPRLTDFGIAKSADGLSAVHTRTGLLLGTPPYMAPEQASGRRDNIGPRTDVYALGATLYELLVGTPPFRGETDVDTLRRVVADAPTRPRQVNASVPLDLEAVCLKCLEKDPARRYATAQDLAEDLHRYLTGQTTTARPATTLDLGWRMLKQYPRAAAVTCMAIMGVITFLVVTTALNYQLKSALKRAETNEELSGRLLYASDMALADAAFRDGDLRQFTELMERHIPDTADLDRRGFEWWALWNRARVAQMVLCDVGSALYCVAATADASTLAVTGADGVIRLFDAVAGRQLQSWDSGQGEVNSICFSSDGLRLASVGDDGTLRVWEVATGRQVMRIDAHKVVAYGVQFAREDSVLVTCANEPVVRLWDATSGELQGELVGHKSSVEAIATSIESAKLASVSSDGYLIVWDLVRKEQTHRLKRHEGYVTAVDISRDGHTVVTGGQDRVVRIWNLRTSEGIAIGEHHDTIQCVRFLPDQTSVVAGDRSGLTRVHSLIPASLENPSAAFDRRIAPGWPEYAAGDAKYWQFEPGTIRWWDLSTATNALIVASEQELRTLDLFSSSETSVPLQNGDLLATAFSVTPTREEDDNRLALSPTGDAMICVNELYSTDDQATTAWQYLRTLPEKAKDIRQVAISNGAHYVAVAREAGTATLWRLADPMRSLDLVQPSTPWSSLEFSPDHQVLATVTRAGQVVLWDTSNGTRTTTLDLESTRIRCAVFVSNDLLLTGSSDGVVRLWDLPSATVEREYRGHTASILALRVSPDARWFASQSDLPCGTQRLWKIESSSPIATISHWPSPRTHQGLALWSPEAAGRNIPFAISANDNRITIIAPAPVEQQTITMRVHKVHNSRVYGCVVLPNGSIVTASGDGRAVLVGGGNPAKKPLLNASSVDIKPTSGSRIAVATTHQNVVEIDVASRKITRQLDGIGRRVSRVGYMHSRDVFLASDLDGTVWQWDGDNRPSIIPLEGVLKSVDDVSASARYLVMTNYGSMRVSIVEPKTFRLLRHFETDVRGKLALLSPGERLLYTDHDNEVHAWAVQTGERRRSFRGRHDQGIDCIALTSDGRLLATGGADRKAVVWDTTSGNAVCEFTGHRAPIRSICFSPDNRSLVTGDARGAIKVWHIATGRQLMELDDLIGSVETVIFTPDGDYLVARLTRFGLVAYDVSTGRARHAIERDSGG